MACTSVDISPPGSPPDLTRSRSSKSSSFRSSSLTDIQESLDDYATHFEDITLGEPPSPSSSAHAEGEPVQCERAIPKHPPARYPAPMLARSRSTASLPKPLKDGTIVQRPDYAGRDQLYGAVRDRLPPNFSRRRELRRAFSTPSSPTSSRPTNSYRQSPIRSPAGSSMLSMSPLSIRSTSSIFSLPSNVNPGQLRSPQQPIRRASWQPKSNRKTAKELEAEYDDSDDDIPDDAIFWNIPITGRLPHERSPSTSPQSPNFHSAPLPEHRLRKHMSAPVRGPENARNIGTKSRPPIAHRITVNGVPGTRGLANTRVRSWTDALADLSEDARKLTQALEAYAGNIESRNKQQELKATIPARPSLDRARTTIAVLQPIQKSNIMIDPLPISKEKERLLCRTRPRWLPPKCPKEDKRHLKEYQQMMTLAQHAENRKVVKEQESHLPMSNAQASVSQIWDDVISGWDTNTPGSRTKELSWAGIPSRLRGEVWQKAVGNELGVSGATYTTVLGRARALDKKLASLDSASKSNIREAMWFGSIRKDAQSVYQELKIFQSGGPLHDSLVDVLMAYSTYRPQVGYAYGIHLVTALLLLNLSASDAFVVLTNILDRRLPASFLTNNSAATSRTYAHVLRALRHNLPTLHAHFASLKLPPAEYLSPLFKTLFTKGPSVDIASRLWDVMVFEGGDDVLIKAAVAVLIKLERRLYGSREEILSLLGWANERTWDLGNEDEFMLHVRGVTLDGGKPDQD